MWVLCRYVKASYITERTWGHTGTMVSSSNMYFSAVGGGAGGVLTVSVRLIQRKWSRNRSLGLGLSFSPWRGDFLIQETHFW